MQNLLALYTSEVNKTGLTWMKVLGMIVVCGSIAIDCIKQYNFNFIHSVPYIFSTVCLNDKTLDWIVANGGWISIKDSYTLNTSK